MATSPAPNQPFDWATMPIGSSSASTPQPQGASFDWATMPIGGADFVKNATAAQLQALSPANRAMLAKQITAEGQQPVSVPQPHGIAQRAENFGIGMLQGVADFGNLVRQGIGAVGQYAPQYSYLGDISKGLNWLSGSTPEQESQQYQDVYGQYPAAKIGRMVGSAAVTAPLAMGAGGAVGAVLPEASGTLGALGRLALQSSAEGGTFGALQNPGPDSNRALNAGLGLATGAVLPISLAGAGRIGKLGLNAVRGLYPSGRRALAESSVGNKLAQLMSIAPESSPVEPALPGMQLTLGQTTGNPAILALEKGVFDTPVGAARYAELRNANSDVILNNAKKLASDIDPDNMDDRSMVLAQQLQGAKQAAAERQRALWNQVDPAHQVFVPKAPVSESVNSAIGSLGPVRSRFIPPEVTSLMDSLPDKIPFSDYKDLRSVVGGIAQKYRIAGDVNAAEASGRVLQALNSNLDNLSTDSMEGIVNNAADTTKSAFNAARDFSRQYHGIFDADPMQRLFRLDRSGAERVAPERVTQNLLTPSLPQGVTQAQKAFSLGGNEASGNDALQSALVSRWLQSAATPERDVDGNAVLSGNRMRKFYNSNSALFGRAFPSQSSQALIKQTMKAVDQNDQIRNYVGTGGSPTALKIQAQTLMNDLMGHVYSPSSSQMGIEGAVLGDLAEGRGAIMPWYVGGRFAGYARQNYLRALRPAREEVLTDALANPTQGLKLMQNANARNARGLFPNLQKLILPGNALASQTPR